MKLLVQPDDGVAPLLEAIEGAKSSLDLYIFRLTYPAVERALADAVSRGVVVRTLIAHVTGSGEDALRKLELRLLGIGATVSRTDEDLLRYHGKMMIVDGRMLYVLGYNFNRKDIERSRSLGVATDRAELVAEALRLFQADFDRKVYTPGLETFVVSPLNSRAALLELLEGAREQLLIYDSRLSDNQMQRVLERQAMKGVEVRVIGKVEKDLREVAVRKYGADRLHVRAIVRDGERVFIGSQSLRRAELERRREIGIIFDDARVASQIAAIFDEDWVRSSGSKEKGAKRARA